MTHLWWSAHSRPPWLLMDTISPKVLRRLVTLLSSARPHMGRGGGATVRGLCCISLFGPNVAFQIQPVLLKWQLQYSIRFNISQSMSTKTKQTINVCICCCFYIDHQIAALLTCIHVFCQALADGGGAITITTLTTLFALSASVATSTNFPGQ